MSLLNKRIKRSGKVAIGCIGIATMTVAAPLSPEASDLHTQERPPRESTTESQQVPPDHSKKNRRDRDDKTRTPMDQGKGAQDIKITQDIRKEINQQKDLSINGKNVKIITVHGVVTLRGPVANTKEKQLINDIACKIAGSTNVKNQLEVE